MLEAAVTGQYSQDLLHTTIHKMIEWVGKEQVIMQVVALDVDQSSRLRPLYESSITLADQYGLQVYAGTSVRYLQPEDQEAYQISLAIKDGMKWQDPHRRKPEFDGSLLTDSQVRSNLISYGCTSDQVQQWMDATGKIAAMCNIVIPQGQVFFPKYHSPDMIKQLYEEHQAGLIVQD